MEAYHVPYLHKGTEGLAGLTLVHHLFPNSMLVIGTGIVVHQRAETSGPGSCLLRVSTYTWPGEATEQNRALADFLWKVLHDKDCRLMAGAQRSFASGSLDRMVLGANEPSVIGLHRNWDAALAGVSPTAQRA